jgi:uncharacterized membrane protein YidH (DUF202 family)
MSLTVGLVVIGVVIAFGAGMRWQHNKRTWADYRLARTGHRNFARLRWVTLWAVVVFLILLGAYLMGLLRMAGG